MNKKVKISILLSLLVLFVSLFVFADSDVMGGLAVSGLFGLLIVFGSIEMLEKKDWSFVFPVLLSIPFFILGLFPAIDVIAGPEKEVVFVEKESILYAEPQEHDIVPNTEAFLEFGGEAYFLDSKLDVDLFKLIGLYPTVTYYKLTNRIINIETP